MKFTNERLGSVLIWILGLVCLVSAFPARAQLISSIEEAKTSRMTLSIVGVDVIGDGSPIVEMRTYPFGVIGEGCGNQSRNERIHSDRNSFAEGSPCDRQAGRSGGLLKPPILHRRFIAANFDTSPAIDSKGWRLPGISENYSSSWESSCLS